MRLAIFENIMTPGGHEVDFDRILVEEFQRLGHEVSFYVPEGFKFNFDYQVPAHYLKGEVVSYSGVRGFRKLWYTVKREQHRLGWYRQLLKLAGEGAFDAIVVPTSTYRYLRAICRSRLRKSPVPIIFILHGINPGEADNFLKEAGKLVSFKNIRPVVLTFGQDIFGQTRENIRYIYPPTYTPRDLKDYCPGKIEGPLTIGFFGQYRREKKLEDFLEVYLRGRESFNREVRLLVQGATMHPEDAEDFERIIARYKGEQGIKFLHKGLIGREWQEAIAGIDVLLLPYSAPRYRYHWGGMLFTALGFGKPVIASDDMNPEVFEAFKVGETFRSGDLADLQRVLTEFINGYEAQEAEYEAGLRAAAEEYSPAAFARRIENIIREQR